jgi:small subunit ribosomal protein S5
MSYSGNDESREKYFEKLIKVNRVTKVNKGGKKLAFRAFVIVGDQNGTVGLATSKSKEVPMAIKRSIEKAKKNMFKINMVNGTIPHEITGEFKSSKVVMRPAPEGTGVIAGGSIRILLESLGIENVVAKSIGSNNSLNMAKAALDGLIRLKSLAQVEAKRGVKIYVYNRESDSTEKKMEAVNDDSSKDNS